MVPHSWITNCLKMYKISDEVINIIEQTMKTRRVKLTRGKTLAGTKIQRGIFQVDALPPLLFIISTMPLSQILRKCTAGYKLTTSQEKINHLMYMDDIKLSAKNEKEWETLIPAVRIYSQDIEMEFGIEKCAMLELKSGKWHRKANWKNMEHESDNYTNRELCFWYSYQRIIKGTGGLGNKRTSGDHPNCNIIENGQNTEKSPGYLRRLAVTQTPVKDNVDVKNSQGIIIIIIIDHRMPARKSDLVFVNKKKSRFCGSRGPPNQSGSENIDKYLDFARELKKLWKLVRLVP